RCLHPVGTSPLAQRTKFYLEVIAAQTRATVGEIIVLKNHLHFRAMAVGLVADPFPFLFDISQSPLNALPTLMTMSISAAPSRHASSVSYCLDSVQLLPCGKPMTAPTST